MRERGWTRRLIAMLAVLGIAATAKGALAPQYRWIVEFPLFVLEPPSGPTVLTLRSLAIDIACTPACTAVGHYDLDSATLPKASVTLPIGPGAIPRLDADGATAQIGREVLPPSLPRPPSPPSPAPGGDDTPQRGRAQAATRTIALSFKQARSSLAVAQPLPLSTRGSGTESAMQGISIETAALARWRRAPGFMLTVAVRVVPSETLATASPPLAFQCTLWPDRSTDKSVPPVPAGPDGSFKTEMRLDGAPPVAIRCFVGAARAVDHMMP